MNMIKTMFAEDEIIVYTESDATFCAHILGWNICDNEYIFVFHEESFKMFLLHPIVSV